VIGVGFESLEIESLKLFSWFYKARSFWQSNHTKIEQKFWKRDAKHLPHYIEDVEDKLKITIKIAVSILINHQKLFEN
jgi:hypothetical protein